MSSLAGITAQAVAETLGPVCPVCRYSRGAHRPDCVSATPTDINRLSSALQPEQWATVLHPLAGAQWVTGRDGTRGLVLPAPARPGGDVAWRLEHVVTWTCPDESADHPAIGCPDRVKLARPVWRDPEFKIRHGRSAELAPATPPDEVLFKARPLTPWDPPPPPNAHRLWTALCAAGRPALLVLSATATHRSECAVCGTSGRKHVPGCDNDPKRETADDGAGQSKGRKTRDVPVIRHTVGVIVPRYLLTSWSRTSTDMTMSEWSGWSTDGGSPATDSVDADGNPIRRPAVGGSLLVRDGRRERVTFTELRRIVAEL